TILASLNATVAILRNRKIEKITMADLYSAAWMNPLSHHSLNPGDLILHAEIPVAPGQRSAYLQMSEKHSFDWALVSCAAAATVDGKTLRNPRVTLGVVAPVPYSSGEANRFLEGKTLDDITAGEAADILLKEATPFEHNGYKV